jgi:DNA primase large subunit
VTSPEVIQHAKYPFTKGAADYVSKKGVSIETILSSAGYREALERGVERVREAVSVHRVSMKSEAKGSIELFSYPVARLVVSLLAEQGIIKYYARAEAARMSDYLLAEPSSREGALRVLKELGVKFDVSDNVYIPVPQYLQVAPRRDEYKLVNQVLGSGGSKGTVVVRDDGALIDLAENALRLRIEDELPLDLDDRTRSTLMPYIDEISKTIYESWVRPVEEKGEVILEAMPPCMHALLDGLHQGTETTHHGRFALTSFLSSIGMNSKEIIELYSRRSDFKLDLTKYQVEHISGNISSTKYTPPECNTMRTYGLCVNMDSLCKRDWMKHPLIYYRVKRRGMEGKK